MKIPLLLTTSLLLLAVPVAWSACTSDADCVAEEAFCGRDGNCTQFSCENWFQNGPAAYTGYDPNNDNVPLTCSDYNDGAAENMNSIVFGCRPYSPGKQAPEAKTWSYFFTELCTASPGGGKEFKCYQNRANSNYGDYIGEAARSDLPPCDRETFDNEQPLFWYIKEARVEDKDGNAIGDPYGVGRDNTASSDSFDPSEADKTMYALLIDTGSSSGGSSGGGGTSDNGGGGSSSAAPIRMWAVVAAIFGNMIWFL